MTSYNFLKGKPGDFLFDGESTLFHDPRHLMLQSAENWTTFYANVGGETRALIHFHVRDKVATSPASAPYGSFLVSREVNEIVLGEFVRFIEDEVKVDKVHEVIIKNYPQFLFNSSLDIIHNVLDRHGFKTFTTEQSSFISVSVNPLEGILHRSHQKRLRKCHDAGYAVQIIEKRQLHDVYDFIMKARQSKGYKVSMTFEAILELAETFPGSILMFGVFDHDKLIASSICIKEKSDSLYDFYHDHDGSYDAYSPVVMLVQGIYDYCQENNIRYINLGTSSIDGGANESLQRFKSRLGAQQSPKVTFHKLLRA